MSRRRPRGAKLLLEAEMLRRRTWWMRLFGAVCAFSGALIQNGISPGLGGLMLAGGLMLLAVAEEVRRKAVSMSQKARSVARHQIAEDLANLSGLEGPAPVGFSPLRQRAA